MATLFTVTGAVHFLAFSLFFGASMLRLFAVKVRPASETLTRPMSETSALGASETLTRPEHLKRFDAIYFNIGGISIMALFGTGMMNVFSGIFMGMHVDREYLVTLGWKLGAALLVILFFIGDLMMSRREKHSPHMLIVQAILFVATGILGFFLMARRPMASAPF